MHTFERDTLAVIGAGNIGRMLVRRLLAAGIPAGQVRLYDADPDKAGKAAEEFGIQGDLLVDEKLSEADIWLLAAPPKTILPLLQSLKSWLKAGNLVISFAAAVPLASLEEAVPAGVQVVRVMPSMTSFVGKGLNPVCFGAAVTQDARLQVERLLSALGEFIEVRDDQMNWCVGLTGAALRALLPVLEGMTAAGIEAGFSDAEARRLAAKMMAGTAALALETNLGFDRLKAMTPLDMVDEKAVADIFYQSIQQTKEKMDALQSRILSP